MTESEGEIECLDEDAEIVQQCVSSLPSTASILPKVPRYQHQRRPHLLVERPVQQKRKRKQDDDSEYEPTDEELPPSPPSSPTLKKKPRGQLVKKPRHNASSEAISYLKLTKHPQLYKPTVNEEFLKRKTCDIRIPDYEDPLCLPVRALKADDSDKKRLNNWNNVCLEHFKRCDTLLRPEQGAIKKSIRTAVFKNVVNRHTGQNETTIWSKTCVENENLDKKSEIFQSVLPRYREKKALPHFLIAQKRDWMGSKTSAEVILSKENHKDGEALVVYKPQDSVSAVYGLIDMHTKSEDGQQAIHDEDSKKFLKELTACRMCAPCFQSSCRGITKAHTKNVVCPVCGRACVTAYNLLSHFKTHSTEDVRPYKKAISALLADMVEYHYRCRMCSRRFDSIRALRAHVKEHEGKEKFTCIVCNRIVNG